ncbi:SRPBCC family protein [Alteribacillus iranensis]|uniref:Carbon monoxide dehydrogenase subunit G n=1 Tax=Alteribacillus iranensis TaxID=930128 RepID=A0A1I2F0X8_9BACI|nr:carbon monoxide dehydrogenase subunit G [Alteribacillus iranensis]SFE98815.1 hypothetical protein SAMN05192532_10824 [Alteribacillus iranensis]
MKLSNEVKFNYPREDIWKALHDPEILKHAIPGCEGLTLQEDGSYDVSMSLGVAAVKGKYNGKVYMTDIEKPNKYLLEAEGSGSPGHVSMKMDCNLEETEEGCLLKWDCDAEIGGKIAGVGSRALGGIAKFMAKKFFDDIKKQLKKGAYTN